MTHQEHPLVVATDLLMSGEAASLGPDVEHLLGVSCGKRLRKDLPPAAAELAALRTCLPKLLVHLSRPTGDACALLLAGIGRYDCLSACLANEEGAFALAMTFVIFADAVWSGNRRAQKAQADAIALFNEWLDLKDPSQVAVNCVPSMYEMTVSRVPRMCELFFGKTWCEFAMLGIDGSYVLDCTCAAIVREARPPFLPGLCPAQDGILSVPLPDLGANP